VSRPAVGLDGKGRAVALWRVAGAGIASSWQVESAFGDAGSAGWSAPMAIAPAFTPAYALRLIVNPAGEALAVWESYAVLSEGHVAIAVVTATGSTLSRSWSAPRALAHWSTDWAKECSGSSCAGGSPREAVPELALNARGDAVVAWDRAYGLRGSIVARVRPGAGRRWAAPVTLSRRSASAVAVALDGRGNAFAVWLAGERCPSECERGGALQAAAWPR
jgi:hypothetical protein